MRDHLAPRPVVMLASTVLLATCGTNPAPHDTIDQIDTIDTIDTSDDAPVASGGQTAVGGRSTGGATGGAGTGGVGATGGAIRDAAMAGGTSGGGGTAGNGGSGPGLGGTAANGGSGPGLGGAAGSQVVDASKPADLAPLPASCPCPLESYCDLATNTCVRGCASDDNCSEGRYCDGQRTCQDGCRAGKCGTNEQCSTTTRTCDCSTGYHRCAGSCVLEDVSSCGSSCQVCPTDPVGKASCTQSACTLTCPSGYLACGGVCASCPSGATSFACDGAKCTASGCSTGSHVCSGACVTEGVRSCGTSCSVCKNTTSGACSSGACYGVIDFGRFPRATTCTERCTSQGKSCGTCNASSQWLSCSGAYTVWADLPCCCSDAVTGTPKPGCTKNSDCKSAEFCWSKWNECYPTLDPTDSCSAPYTEADMCSDGSLFCPHSGLPSGTTYTADACPAGTTQRGSWYCSQVTKICVPD